MVLITFIGLCVVFYFLFYLVVMAVSDCDAALLFYSKFGFKLDYFRNKVVWITGASSGIGEFMAIEMARNGAKLILTARNSTELERVRNKCLGEGAARDDILLLPFDVTDLAKHEEYFLRVIQHFGKLDILVNNAGRSQRADWESIEVEVDKEMFELNVFSVVSLSRIAVRYFATAGGGTIAVTSSVAGIFGAPYSGTYTATKHALHGYFKSLRIEKMNMNINVTLLCPGPVVSNILPQSFTSRPGETYGHEMPPNDKRMATDRCAYLSCVAIANQLDEVWMGIFPIIPLTYMIVYMPNLVTRIAKLIGLKNIQKMRDNKEVMRRTASSSNTAAN